MIERCCWFFLVFSYFLCTPLLYAKNNSGISNFFSKQKETHASNIKFPRFESLKKDKTNMRNGPNQDQPILWTYTAKGLPVEVISEYDGFKKIRDYDGSEGWVVNYLLSRRRTIITLEGTHNIYEKPEKSSDIIAKIEGGVIALPLECDYIFCYITHNDIEGWILKENIYGVYEDEIL